MRGVYINLDRSADRRAHIEAAVRPLMPGLERLAASTPDDLPPGFRVAGARENPQRLRTAACFLSHMRAWARVAEMGGPGALVLEDDARPQPTFANRAPMLLEAPTLGDLDLVFVNQRMRAWLRAVGPEARRLGLLAPLDAVVARLVPAHPDAGKGRGFKLPHPGAEAYWVSPEGAAKLLRIAEDYRVNSNLDWFLASCALAGAPAAARFATMNALLSRGDLDRRVAEAGGVRGAIFSRPLFGAASQLTSVRQRDQGPGEEKSA